MAQTFHLPIVHLVDCPGFQVGLRAESTAVIRWGVRALAAIDRLRLPYRTAGAFRVEDVIDPRDTRKLLCDFANPAAPLRTPGPSAFGMRP